MIWTPILEIRQPERKETTIWLTVKVAFVFLCLAFELCEVKENAAIKAGPVAGWQE